MKTFDELIQDRKSNNKKRDSSNESLSNNNQRSFDSIIAERNKSKLLSKINLLSSNRANFVEEHNSRYFDSAGNYIQKYRSDSEDWLNQVKNNQNSLEQQERDIRYELSKYGEYYDEELLNNIYSVLDSDNGVFEQIVKHSSKDNDYFSQWENEEAYKRDYTNATYTKKYSGYTFAELQKTKADIKTKIDNGEDTDGSLAKEYEWINNHQTDVQFAETMTAEELEQYKKEYEDLSPERNFDEAVLKIGKWLEDNGIIPVGGDVAKLITLLVDETGERFGSDTIGGYVHGENPSTDILYYDEDGAAVTADTLLNIRATEEKFNLQDISVDELEKDLEIINRVRTTLATHPTPGKDGNGDIKYENYSPQFKSDMEYLLKKYGIEDTKSEKDANGRVINSRLPFDVFQDIQALETYANWKVDKSNYAEEQLKNAEFATNHPVLATGKAIVSAPLTIGEFLEDAVGGANFTKPEYGVHNLSNVYDNTTTNQNNVYTGTVQQNINDYVLNETDSEVLAWLASNAYSGGVSSAQSAITTLACTAVFGEFGGTVALGIMGMEAASSSYTNAVLNGSTNGEALLTGVASGVAEVIFEKFSLDGLIKIGSMYDTSSMAALLTSAIKSSGSLAAQGITEASEEFFTEITNKLADEIINGDHSAYNNAVAKYQKMGYSYDDAVEIATKEVVEDILSSLYGGFIGGVGSGAGASTYQGTRATGTVIGNKIASDRYYNQQGKNIVANKGVQDLVDSAKDIPALRKLADKVAGVKTDDFTSKKYEKQVGKLYKGVQEAQIKALDKTTEAAFKNVIKAELESSGVANADKVADVLTKAMYGGGLTQTETKILESVDGTSILNKVLNSTEFSEKLSTEQKAQLEGNIGKYVDTRNLTEVKGEVTIDATDEKVDSMVVASLDGEDITLDVKTGDKHQRVKSGELRLSKGYEVVFEGLMDIKNDFGLDESTATKILTLWEGYKGSAEMFMKAIESSFMYGQYNMRFDFDKSEVVKFLPEDTRNQVYEMGREYKQKVTDKKAVSDKKTATADHVSRVTFAEGVSYNKLTKSQKAQVDFAQVIAQTFGFNLEIFRSPKNALGHSIGENGSYNLSTNTMRLDIDAGTLDGKSLILFTQSHELTHFIKKWSPEAYKTFADLLIKKYGEKGVSVDDLVQRQINNSILAAQADKSGKHHKLSYDEAFDEVVCNACEDFLADPNIQQTILDIAKVDQSIADKIKNFIKNLVNRLEKAIRGLQGQSVEANQLRELNLDDIQELKAHWMAALVDSRENVLQARKNDAEAQKNTTDEGDVKLQARFKGHSNIENNGNKRYNKKTFYNEYATNMMQWANSASTEVGDLKILNNKGKWVLLEATENGCIELRSGTYKEMKHLEQTYRNATDSLYGHIEKFRSGERRDTWDLFNSKNRGYDDRDGEQNGSQEFQIDSERDNEHLRSGDKRESVKFQDRSDDHNADLYSRISEMQFEVGRLRRSMESIEYSEEFKEEQRKLSEAFSKDVDTGIELYKEWLEKSEYSKLKNKKDALEAELDKLRAERDKEISSKALTEENEAIAKSGLSEADYFRKQAVKEFGYTPYFYDAGYITPNGKMLNFSGEKGKHFSTRGQDHRAISSIYAETSGTDALNRFMRDGNIRILASESPGLDISTVVEPTKEQYSTIRKFVSEYANKEFFNVDLTDESGKVIGSLEYEGRINSARVINDIKHFYATGEIREQSSVGKFLYSDRPIDSAINQSMTMEQAKTMIQKAFVLGGILEWYEGEYKNGDEWIRGVGTSEVALNIESEYTLMDKYFNDIQGYIDGDIYVEDVLDAYLEGTLVGKQAEKAKRLDVGKGYDVTDNRFYAPKKYSDIKSLWETANTKVTKANKSQVNEARKSFLFAAHNKDVAKELNITPSEVNKKLRSWSNYSANAKDISTRLNNGVAESNQWSGIQNCSILSQISVTDEDISSMVKEIKGTSSEYQRNYIARTMLALNTHIDWSELIFDFKKGFVDENRRSVKGLYKDSERTITIGGSSYQNTVAHEMGHALDYKWQRDLFGEHAYNSALSNNHTRLDLIKGGEEAQQFYKNFRNFIKSLTDVTVNYSAYTMDAGETFARFVARFVEWVNLTANNNAFRETDFYGDKFTASQYIEFVKLLQEKAMLDAKKMSNDTLAEDVKFQDRVTPEQDAEYLELAKNPEKNEARLREMVDSVARANGYTIRAYHATNADFTVFDIEKTADFNYHGKGIYFTNSTRDVENNYENYEGPDPWEKIDARAYELADEMYGISYEDTLTGDADIIDKLNECYDEAIDEFKSTIRRVTAYLKFDNPVILKKGESSDYEYDMSKHDGIIDEQVYENIGHSGMDENTIHYVVRNPRNIKSAELVTYDDNGNIIPLSERFNESNEDIRYQDRVYNGSLTQERIDDLIHDSGAGKRVDYAKEWVASINPSDFLDLTLGYEIRRKGRDYFDAEVEGDHGSVMGDRDYIADLQGSNTIPVLYVNMDSGKVAMHNGRHRMRALEKAGATRTPVRIVFYNEDDMYKGNNKGERLETINIMRLTSQFDDKFYHQHKAYIHDIIPLNEDHRAEIEKTYRARSFEVKQGWTVAYQDRPYNPSLEDLGVDYKAENEKLKADVDRLKEMHKLQGTVTHGKVLAKASYEGVAKKLLHGFGMKRVTDADLLKEFVNKLDSFYSYIINEDDLMWDEVFDKSMDIARWVDSRLPVMELREDYADEILKDIHSVKISLDDAQMAEVAYAYGSYNAFRKSNFGTIKLTNDGIKLDSQWSEWSNNYPWVFDADTNSADMPVKLVEIISDLKTAYSVTEEYDKTDELRSMATEIYDSYWNIPTVKTLADKHQQQVNLLKSKHREEMDALKEKKSSELKDAKERYQEMVKKVRADKDAKLNAYKERVTEQKKKNVEGRNKTATKNKIKKVVKTLESLYGNPSKEKNVKIEFQDMVKKALIMADVIFDSGNISSYDVLSGNITTRLSDNDKKNLDEWRKIQKAKEGYQQRLDALESSEKVNPKTHEELLKMISECNKKLNALSRKLADVVERQKAELNDTAVQDAIDSLVEAYKSLEDSTEGYAKAAYNDYVAKRLDTLKTSLKNTTVKTMTLTQLDEVYQAYKMVLTTVRTANELFINNKRMSVIDMGEAVIREVERVAKPTDDKIAALREAKKFIWDELKPIYAFERIGSKTLLDLYKYARKGEDVYARDVSEAAEFFKNKNKAYDFDSWDFKERKDFKLADGRTFSISLQEIMSIYAYSKREQALDHIVKGGFVFDDKEFFTKTKEKGIKGKIKRQRTTVEAYRLNDDVFYKVINSLTKEQKKFVDDMQEYLSAVMGEKGNEVSRVLYGIDLFKEKYYFPLMSSNDFFQQTNNPVGEVALKNSGMAKATVPHARNPIVLQGFMDVWSAHVNKMSTYHAFVLPIENLNKVYNYTGYARDNHSVSVQTILKGVYGDGVDQYIKNFITDLNGGVKVQSSGSFAMGLINKFKKTAVSASSSVVVQQPTAIIRAMAMLDPKYFVHENDGLKHNEAWEELKKYAPIAVIKEMGGFDVGGGKQIGDYITAKEYKGFDKVKGFFTDGTYRDEALMWGASKADELSWVYIWNSVKKEIADTTTYKVGSEEFLNTCGERFTEIIAYTQVYDSVFSRSGWMRNKGEIAKMATSFMGEPTTSFNMLYNAVLQAKRGNISKGNATRIVSATMASIILAAVAKSFIYALRDDDEDEAYAEKYAQALTNSLMEDLFIPNMLPFVSDFTSLLSGWDVERTDMAIIKDVVDAFDGLDSSSKSGYRKVEDLAGAIAALFGVPLKNVMRTAREMYNFVANIFDENTADVEDVGDAVVETFTGETSASDVNKLLEKGKTDKANKLINELVAEKVKQGKTEKEAKASIKSSITSYWKELYLQAYRDKDNAEMLRIRRILQSTGLYDDVVKTCSNWIKGMKDEEETKYTKW